MGTKLRVVNFFQSLSPFVFTDHQFSNGCHAPPWQQVHGDISYLDVKPFDCDKLTITANTAGYFLNKGLTQDGQVDYERDGEVYPTLVALLKAKSPQFASAIDKKVSTELYDFSFCKDNSVTACCVFCSVLLLILPPSFWYLLSSIIFEMLRRGGDLQLGRLTSDFNIGDTRLTLVIALFP